MRDLALSIVRACALLLAGAVALPAVARADQLKAFDPARNGDPANGPGIPCVPREGVRFCEGTAGTSRVGTFPAGPAGAEVPNEVVDPSVPDTRERSFDGTPLDVNVALPATGDGPFPLIVLRPGFPAGKDGFDALRPWAQRGYAVMSYTPRGLRDSCGTAASRAVAPQQCARGWAHFVDLRYETHDTQWLAGLLADQGLVDPQRIGVAGGSYGGGQSYQLAAMPDRVMEPDGSVVPWVSAKLHLPMRIAAAVPYMGWSDMASLFADNGRYLDYEVAGPRDQITPLGVFKPMTVIDGLAVEGAVKGAYFAPPGADPSADPTTWLSVFHAGLYFDENPVARSIADDLVEHHSAYWALTQLHRPPAPTLIGQGFTDALMTVTQALRWTGYVRAHYPSVPVAEIFGDFGHAPAQDKPDAVSAFFAARVAWFDHYVKGDDVPVPTGVSAFTETCPKSAPSGGPYRAPTWDRLHPGEVRFDASGAKQIGPGSVGDPRNGKDYNPNPGSGACVAENPGDAPNSAAWRFPPASGSGYTLLGSPTVVADLAVTGLHSQLVARLIDVAPDGRQTLVARGVYRPTGSGRQVLQLFPGAWHFDAGHAPKLELLSADVPYARPSNFPFTITVSGLKLRLPTAEHPDGRQIDPPAPPP